MKISRIAIIADLHNAPSQDTLNSINMEHPDFITIPGDILYAGGQNHSIYDHVPSSGQHLRNAGNALFFLQEAVKIAPVIFSTGNHELYLDEEDKSLLANIGVTFLDAVMWSLAVFLHHIRSLPGLVLCIQKQNISAAGIWYLRV